jgi:beta-galactosidase
MVWEQSLHGIWNFCFGEESEAEKAYITGEFENKINIPGILQAQGYGREITETTPWVSGLHDKLWFQREEYKTEGGEINVPFLSQPPRHYLGKAWYEKSFQVPEDLEDCVFYFVMECVKWKTKLWLDSKYIGTEMSLCTPHIYCLGNLKGGVHCIRLCVDNGFQAPYRPDGHMVSDALGASWNGLTGRVSIYAVPGVHMENIKVSAEPASGKVVAAVTLKNLTGREQKGLLQIREKQVDFTIKDQFKTVIIELSYQKEMDVWDEFTPNLHQLKVILSCLERQETKEITFGFRKIEVKDGLFLVNNRPAFFRGTHSGGDFPLTGYPPSEVSYWRKLMETCKNWGLNFIRFHSFCPPEAAFVAADEVGLYLQIECGMWNKFQDNCKMNDILWEETRRILDTFGNHPSFVMLSPSNEPGGDWYKPLTAWVSKCRAKDKRRLYTTQSGWPYPVEPAAINGTDYVYFHRSGYGLQPGGTIRNSQGWHGKDYGLSLEGIKYPVISHELGQWCSYPDFTVMDKFTGYLKPGNYRALKENAERNGVLNQNKEFAYLSGKLKVQLYKEEIEATFRTPHIYGFELLDLHDYLGQGTACVGLLDPFWEEKGFVTPEEFKSFCRETVLLIRLSKRVYTTGDVLECPVEICHFGREEISKAGIYWSITNRKKETVLRGEFPSIDLPVKKNIEVGTLKVNLKALSAPEVYEIQVGIVETDLNNSWNFWLYEELEDSFEDISELKVLYTHSLEQAIEALSLGQRVIFSPLPDHYGLDSPSLSLRPSFWNSQMGPTYSRGMGLVIRENHPALACFPTRSYQEWQWEEILNGAYGLNLKEFPAELIPIVQPIDDYNRNYRQGMILECRVSEGSLLIVTADLDTDIEHRPAALLLKKSLLNYASSCDFEPQTVVSKEVLSNALFPRRIMLDCQVKAKLLTEDKVESKSEGMELSIPSNNSDYSFLLDGDPNTFCTGEQFKYPFTLELEAERDMEVKGLLYMPRQNEREHKGDIKGCLVQTYDNGRWKTVFEGELSSSYGPKEIIFREKITLRKIRFTALYGFSAKKLSYYKETPEGWLSFTEDYKDTTAAIAELLFIPAGDMISYTRNTRKENTGGDKYTKKTVIEKSATKEIEY